MADEVVLLSLWASPFCIRVMIALAEKGVEYEYKEDDLYNKSPLLLESNPVYKKIPVLIHNGRPVCESLVILQYIDDVWDKSPSLLPRDPYQRANARFWADFGDNKLKCSLGLWLNKGVVQEGVREEYIGHLKLLEGELGDKPYFGGDAFGYADSALVSLACWFYTYEKFGSFSIEEECPKLMAWVRRCMKRESVSKSLPDSRKVYEFACNRRKRLGFE